MLSAFIALSRFCISPVFFINLALFATPNKVPVVSKKFTNKNEIITLIIATSKAPIISNFKKTGNGSGGSDIIPLNFINPENIAIEVIVNMPIIIDPEIFLKDKIVIIKKPNIDNRVLFFT